MIPHDLLPIRRPLEDTTEYKEDYFYNEIVSKLIPDIIQIEANGIPINLDKVSVLEDTVINVLDKVHSKLANNELMLDFLSSVSKKTKESKKKELESKKKTWEEFYKEFDINNKTHRSYVINTYLSADNDRKDMCMEEWSIKDLKKLNQILASRFLQNLLDKKVDSSMSECIGVAMIQLAEDKATLYNKNKVDTKITELEDKDLIRSFNPGSSTQKQNFFQYYGIESESETTKGNPKFDRNELERLQRLVNLLLDNKEKYNE